MQHLRGHVRRHGDVEGEVAADVGHAVVVAERVFGAVARVDVDVGVLAQVDPLDVAELWAEGETVRNGGRLVLGFEETY